MILLSSHALRILIIAATNAILVANIFSYRKRESDSAILVAIVRAGDYISQTMTTLRDKYKQMQLERDARIVERVNAVDADGKRLYSNTEIAAEECVSRQMIDGIIKRLERGGRLQPNGKGE